MPSRSRSRASALEIWLACQSVLFGLWLLLPIETFRGAPSFATMSQLAPEWAWGLFIGGFGALKLAAMRYGSLWLRRWMAFLLCVLWISVAASFVLASSPSTGIPTYAWVSVGWAWAFVRLGARRQPDV